MDRRVTSPTWSPPPPCKQVPKTIKSRMCLECMMDVSFIPVTNITNEYLKRQIAIWRKKIVFLEKKLNKQNYNQYLKYLNYWNFPIANFFASRYVLSLRTADAFPIVASLPPLFFGGREVTTGNTSAVRRLVRASSKVTFITDRIRFPWLQRSIWLVELLLGYML